MRRLSIIFSTIVLLATNIAFSAHAAEQKTSADHPSKLSNIRERFEITEIPEVEPTEIQFTDRLNGKLIFRFELDHDLKTLEVTWLQVQAMDGGGQGPGSGWGGRLMDELLPYIKLYEVKKVKVFSTAGSWPFYFKLGFRNGEGRGLKDAAMLFEVLRSTKLTDEEKHSFKAGLAILDALQKFESMDLSKEALTSRSPVAELFKMCYFPSMSTSPPASGYYDWNAGYADLHLEGRAFALWVTSEGPLGSRTRQAGEQLLHEELASTYTPANFILKTGVLNDLEKSRACLQHFAQRYGQLEEPETRTYFTTFDSLLVKVKALSPAQEAKDTESSSQQMPATLELRIR